MEKRSFGYCRVSTGAQDHQLQIDALVASGVEVENIVIETGSGVRDRPALEGLIRSLKNGDTLTVWRLDRLGRSVPDLYELLGWIDGAGATLVSIKDGVNTSSSATGKLFIGLLAVLSAFERDLLVERTRAGLAASKKQKGRPPKLTAAVIKQVALAHSDPSSTVDETCQALSISRSTYYTALQKAEACETEGVLAAERPIPA